MLHTTYKVPSYRYVTPEPELYLAERRVWKEGI